MIDKVVISEDDNKKIEISKILHDYCHYYKPEDVVLNEYELNFLLKIALEIAPFYDVSDTKPTVKLISNIPIIRKDHSIKLLEPYDMFNPILNYLSEYNSLRDIEE